MKATCKTCGGEVPNHVPSMLDPEGIGNLAHKLSNPMNEDKELDEILEPVEHCCGNTGQWDAGKAKKRIKSLFQKSQRKAELKARIQELDKRLSDLLYAKGYTDNHGHFLKQIREVEAEIAIYQSQLSKIEEEGADG